jgi:hypothetical protein
MEPFPKFGRRWSGWLAEPASDVIFKFNRQRQRTALLNFWPFSKLATL